jgi:hypothetical protein
MTSQCVYFRYPYNFSYAHILIPPVKTRTLVAATIFTFSLNLPDIVGR